MKKLSSAEIRSTFLHFFEERGHRIVPSSSLIPVGDPTLLFTNAGMVQFKNLFLGLEKRDYTRATTAQKCMRVSGKHNDLENVGPSNRHHTFFEMLGNFSFGDYFKKEAIRFAWDLLLNVYELPVERLWFTVYTDDDEAFQYWQDVGASPDRILRFGEKENFWAMGDTGPCGPCSEIHFYTGDLEKQSAEGVNNSDEYIEIWNLVFMQYERDASGNMTPLPRPSIDTGMGLERMAAILQGVKSNYQTDLFMPIILKTQQLLGHTDRERMERIVSYRVIADHSRAVTFLIGDGVLPGNEGRGYVLRLILRRAARHGRMLGFKGPFLAEIADTVIDVMGEHYHELVDRRDFILKTITAEEERFLRTLDTGLELLDEILSREDVKNRKVIPGDDVFRLYDTYGFPLDLTKDVAKEHGIGVDEEGFRQRLEEQKARSRAAAQFGAVLDENADRYLSVLQELQEQGILGRSGVQHLYLEAEELDTRVAAILKDGEPVSIARQGEEVEIVLAETPFYVESGGQVSDTGTIVGHTDGNGQGWSIEVTDVRRPVPGLIVHIGKVVNGTVRPGDPAHASVDSERRWDIRRNHTATHILHNKLRQVLGTHVYQAGSLVAPDRLRFDFTHPMAMTEEQLREVEYLVNQAIMQDDPVDWVVKPYQEAIKLGAMALFGEKYGEEVRVVAIGEDLDHAWSKEFCGGTHVERTGQIGPFVIISESSVSASARRIEAVTGRYAVRYIREQLDRLHRLSGRLGVPPEEAESRLEDVFEELRGAQKELAHVRESQARSSVEDLLSRVQDVGGVKVLAAQVQAEDVATMRRMTDWLRDKMRSGLVVLGAEIGGKPILIAAATRDVVEKGIKAGDVVRAIAPIVGGGGGGRPQMAQAGGKDPAKLPEALAKVIPWVQERLARER